MVFIMELSMLIPSGNEFEFLLFECHKSFRSTKIQVPTLLGVSRSILGW